MDKPPILPSKFEDAERFQRLFVKPMTDAVSAELKNSLQPISEKLDRLSQRQDSDEHRIGKLEKSYSKALVGWGVFAAGASVVVGTLWNVIKGALGL